MNRRTLIAAITLAPLAACTTTGSTTALDINRIVTDGGAIVTAAQAAIVAPSVTKLLGSKLDTAVAALAAAKSALAEIQTVTGGTASVDTSTVQALVTTLLSNSQTVLTIGTSAVPQLSGAMATQIGDYLAAAQALIPLVQVAAQLSKTGAERPRMTEAQALAVIRGVRAAAVEPYHPVFW